MTKRWIVTGSIIVLAGLGAGLAWYVLRAGKHVRVGHAVPSAITSPKSATDSAITSATGIAATQLTAQTQAFADALQSGTEMLRPDLTNVSEELIAQVFKGLSDPTDIVTVIEPYMRGSTKQARDIAKRFFEYMLTHYQEERLQACAHNRLALLWSRDALNEDVFDPAAFAESVRHSEAVLRMPSKKYWYLVTLDELGMDYMIAGNMTGEYDTYYPQAFACFKQLYEEATRPSIRDNALCFMLRCLKTKEEKKAFYVRHKHELVTPDWKADFEEQARHLGLGNGR